MHINNTDWDNLTLNLLTTSVLMRLSNGHILTVIKIFWNIQDQKKVSANSFRTSRYCDLYPGDKLMLKFKAFASEILWKYFQITCTVIICQNVIIIFQIVVYLSTVYVVVRRANPLESEDYCSQITFLLIFIIIILL